MSFADDGIGRRILQGIGPMSVTVDVACETGDLLGRSGTNILQYQPCTSGVPAVCVAGCNGGSGDAIIAYSEAIVFKGAGSTRDWPSSPKTGATVTYAGDFFSATAYDFASAGIDVYAAAGGKIGIGTAGAGFQTAAVGYSVDANTVYLSPALAGTAVAGGG